MSLYNSTYVNMYIYIHISFVNNSKQLLYPYRRSLYRKVLLLLLLLLLVLLFVGYRIVLHYDVLVACFVHFTLQHVPSFQSHWRNVKPGHKRETFWYCNESADLG